TSARSAASCRASGRHHNRTEHSATDRRSDWLGCGIAKDKSPNQGGRLMDTFNEQRAEGLTVHVPMVFCKRGGRKLIIAPDSDTPEPPRACVDNALVKALARAFRWRKLLESGKHASIEELASAEKINPSYVSRVLRLSLLSPNVVEAILGGRQPQALTLAKVI